MIIEVQRKGHLQRMTYDEFEARIREGQLPPETMIRFETVTGDAFKQVGELELYEVLADPKALQFRKNLTQFGLPIATAILIGFQVRIYLWAWVPGAERWLQENLTNWAPAILEQGEVYRLFSYGVLHVSFTHLLFNMLFLAYTAWNLERALGRANLLLLYFGSVFTGGLLSMAMAPDRPSLGASGGDFGLLAAVVVFGWKYWESIPPRSRKYFGYALVPYLAFSMGCGLNAENVDNWGHIGGLLGGGLLMTFLEPEVLEGKPKHNRRVRRFSIAVAAAICLALVFVGPRLVPLTPVMDGGWTVQRPAYWRQGWTFTGDRGWFAPTGNATLVATTIIHPHPISLDDAANNLLQRIGSGGRAPDVLSTHDFTVEGWPARSIELAFELSGEPQQVAAVVMARGVSEHRIQFQTIAEVAEHYAPLSTRITSSIEVMDSQELAEAERYAQTHPRSWAPAAELGEILYREGMPDQALEAFEKALSLSPLEPRAWKGLLRTYADYDIDGGAEIARRGLRTLPQEPEVVVAAVDALRAAGLEQEGRAELERAWAFNPGDRVLRRARLRWGLDIELDAHAGSPLGDGLQ